MSSLDISKLKNRWMGIWDPNVRYLQNDVVQYRGSAFVCIKDLPEQNIIVQDLSISTNYYEAAAPLVHLQSVEISDTDYWQNMMPGMAFKRSWSPMYQYHVGDVVEAAGDLFICIEAGFNIWIEDTDKWVKLIENADRDQRYKAAVLYNNQPLGWQYNMGDKWWGTETDTMFFGFLGFDGNAYHGGLFANQNNISNVANNAYLLSWKTSCFTFVDWLDSTDNFGTGNFTTPDGESPRVVQWHISGGNDGVGYWVMNNGELYSQGYNGLGQMGVGNTTNYYYPMRVKATDTTDWLGNTISKTFSQTKIVKVANSSCGWQNGYTASSTWAIGDDGTVWCWGYNNVGQLGLGNPSTNAAINTTHTNQYNPVRMPSSYFDHKKIVDIFAYGAQYGRCFFLDEDGFLWWVGTDFSGEAGTGNQYETTSGGYYVNHTPQRVQVDWNKHGGMKKLMVNTNSNGYNGVTFVLDGNGYLWNAGNPQNPGISQWWGLSNSGTTDYGSGGFKRLDRDWYGHHKIENFWYLGDGLYPVLIIREKGTGLTYAAGQNSDGVKGNIVNHRYTGTNFNPIPSYVRGPRFVKQACNFSTGNYDQGPTICMVTDDGEAWGNGRNVSGSLSLGYAGQTPPNSRWSHSYIDVASQNMYKRVKTPPGLKVLSVGGWTGRPDTNSDYDASIWQMSDGSILTCGSDGHSRFHSLQGLDTGQDFTGYIWNAYTMHGYSG